MGTTVVDRDSGSGTEVAPAGATSVVPESVGGGGGGGANATPQGGGGGGAGYCKDNSRAVASGDQCAYVIGAAGTGETGNTAANATDGGTSTVKTGTGAYAGINHSATGGGKTNTSIGGSGGIPTGGTNANTTGNLGNGGGSCCGPGLGGDAGQIIGSGNRGKGGNGNSGSGGNGIAGRARFTYTTSSGSYIGARQHNRREPQFPRLLSIYRDGDFDLVEIFEQMADGAVTTLWERGELSRHDWLALEQGARILHVDRENCLEALRLRFPYMAAIARPRLFVPRPSLIAA